MRNDDAPTLGACAEIDSQSDDEVLRRAQEFYRNDATPADVPDFSDRPVSREVIEYCIHAAGTSPSGANLQAVGILWL